MDDATRLQAFLQTIGDANRLRILSLIGREKRSVSEIVEATQLSQPLVSHHLRILKENQILVTERSGPFIFYKLKNEKLLDLLGLISEIAPEVARKKGGNTMFDFPVKMRNFMKYK